LFNFSKYFLFSTKLHDFFILVGDKKEQASAYLEKTVPKLTWVNLKTFRVFKLKSPLSTKNVKVILTFKFLR